MSFAKELDAAGKISRAPMFAIQRVPQYCGVNGIHYWLDMCQMAGWYSLCIQSSLEMYPCIFEDSVINDEVMINTVAL